MEYAFEGGWLADKQDGRPSVFTSALVEGLATGDADRDEDGYISLNELYDYVFSKVKERNPHQTPSRRFELEGDLYLARSQRYRIHPLPIPQELQAALADGSMYARRGAIPELEALLNSPDLPVAAGAYRALATLGRTDIPYVADVASAAARRAEVSLEETELDFGVQRQGSGPAHRTVKLLGPHIARACRARASHDQIGVSHTAAGLDIWIDTATPGALHGRVSVRGHTGAAEITVSGEVASSVPERQGTRTRFLYLSVILPIMIGALAFALTSPYGLRPRPDPVFHSNTEATAQLLTLVVGCCLAGWANSTGGFARERPTYMREQATGQFGRALPAVQGDQAVGAERGAIGGDPRHRLGPVLRETAVLRRGPKRHHRSGRGDANRDDRAVGHVDVPRPAALGLLPTNEVAVPLLVGLVLFGGVGLSAWNVPGLAQVAWLFPSSWGMSALASTVNLNFTLLSSGNKPDPFWNHAAASWIENIVALVVLGVVYLIIARWRLARLTPGRRQ